MLSSIAATPSKIGGYDYHFVKEPPDTTVCVICQLPSRDPYLSVCCGHVFCKSCLDSAKKAVAVVATNCPMCRSEGFAVFPNRQIDRVVRSLHICCTNKEKGCKWQGEVNYISDHLGRSDGCDFEDVRCSNKCGEIVQRQYLVSHMEAECPCRMVTCQYCGVDGEYQLIEGEHKQLCPKFLLPCPNKCDVGSVPRQDMTEHRKICPLEEVECSNKCGKILQRQYLGSHLETKCPRRIMNCQYCQLTGEHQFIEGQHKEHCPKFPLHCPNNCDSEFKVSREDMDTHRKECPLETVQCQYQCVGCDGVMVRKHQREHNKENMEEHLALAVSELVSAKTAMMILKQQLTKTEQELSLTKVELLQKVTSTEHELATIKKELKTTKCKNSIAHAGFLVTEIKHKISLLKGELEKQLVCIAKDTASVNKKYLDMEKTTKDELQQKVASVHTYVKQLLESQHWNCLLDKQKGEEIKGDINQRVGIVRLYVNNTKEQIIPKLVTTVASNISCIRQQVDDAECLITKSINELIPQLDMLMKELSTYGEKDTVKMLNVARMDTMRSKDKMMARLMSKRKDISDIQKRMDSFEGSITMTMEELLQQLSNEHEKAKQKIDYLCDY